MKTKIKALCISAALAVSVVPSFTSCIDETLPTNGVTSDQVNESDKSIEAQVLGLNSYATRQWSSTWQFSIGYPALMIVRNIQSGEMAYGDNVTGCGYINWVADIYLTREYLLNQFLWYYQQAWVGAANSALRAINAQKGGDGAEMSDELKGYYGAALTYRAMINLDLAREFEWLPSDKVTSGVSPEGNPIEGLTIPIVTENTTEEEAKNNPRVKRADMAKFILSDLNTAAENIGYLEDNSRLMPHLDVVYGLMARCYMWIEDYSNAEKYARMSIDASSSTPITRDQALSTASGFNDINQFMWGSQYYSGNVNNIYCWTANMCNETTYGYTGTMVNTNVMIDANMYKRISDSDWRKLEWKAPETSQLYGQNTYCDAEVGEQLQDYASLKFRPGGGKVGDYTVGNVTAFPLMRIEEMYFIEAEAAAHQDAARGARLLTDFMTMYRDNSYSFTSTDQGAVIDEIVFQKAIELWGEGQYWFDVKRLNIPVTMLYEDSNHTSGYQYNTATRPAWMSWQISNGEERTNMGVNGYNNPNNSYLYHNN